MDELMALVRRYGDARAGKALHNGPEQQASCDIALSAVTDATDATRAQLAAAERERDEARAEINAAQEVVVRNAGPMATHLASLPQDVSNALAAAQAECAELWAAAGDVMGAFPHIAGSVAGLSLAAILSRPPGTTEALRAMLERAVLATMQACEREAGLDEGTMFAVNGGAIVARLLPPTGDEAKKGAEG